jgi:hypothetical protein
MKTSFRPVLLAASALLAVCSASAQVADLVTVEKLVEYVQTSASAPSLDTNPYRFDVAITSLTDANVSGFTPTPSVTLSAGSAATGNTTVYNGGLLVHNDGEWRYGSDGAGGGGYGSNFALQSTLHSQFTNNTYGVTVEGHSYTLDLNGATNDQGYFPGFIPTVTMTGGSWIGGKYVIDVSQELTITTNSFDLFHTTGIGGLINIDLDLDDGGSSIVLSRIAPASFASNIETDLGITTATLTIAANTLTAGMDIEGAASFHRIVSQDTSRAGVFAVAWWGNETDFTISTISAIPEPSTYAAFAGLGALGLVVWQRRRRQPTA